MIYEKCRKLFEEIHALIGGTIFIRCTQYIVFCPCPANPVLFHSLCTDPHSAPRRKKSNSGATFPVLACIKLSFRPQATPNETYHQ